LEPESKIIELRLHAAVNPPEVCLMMLGSFEVCRASLV